MSKYIYATVIAVVALVLIVGNKTNSLDENSSNTIQLLISNTSSLYKVDGNEEVINQFENYIDTQLNNLYTVNLRFADDGEIVRQVAEDQNTIGYLNGLSSIAAEKILNLKVDPVLMAENMYNADQAGKYEKEKVFETRLILATNIENKEKYGTYDSNQLIQKIYREDSDTTFGLVEGKYNASTIWLNYLANESDMSLNQLQLKYYPSEQALGEALKSSEVDFIVTDANDAWTYGEELLNSTDSLKIPPEVIIVNKKLSKGKREALAQCLTVIESNYESLQALEKIYHNVGFEKIKPFSSIEKYKSIMNVVNTYSEEVGKI